MVQQTLAGCRVVEDLADERGLARFRDEVLEARGRRVETLQEERVERGVARRELRRVEVPTLVEAVRERVTHVVVVQLPGGVHRGPVLLDLTDVECRPTR